LSLSFYNPRRRKSGSSNRKGSSHLNPRTQERGAKCGGNMSRQRQVPRGLSARKHDSLQLRAGRRVERRVLSPMWVCETLKGKS
jgi:hypothetical protein